MKPLLTLLLSCLSACAATPSFSSFNTNQFSTNNLFISIKDGVLITNLNVITQLTLNSTNIVNLFAPSSVTNGPVGTTINPTDNYLPYRSNATTFGDSPFYQVGTTNVALNSQIVFGPGITNMLYRWIPTDEIYLQNDTPAVPGYSTLVLTNGNHGYSTAIGSTFVGSLLEARGSGSQLQIAWGNGVYQLIATSSMLVPNSVGVIDIGRKTTPFSDIHLLGTNLLWGFYDSLATNYSGLALNHTGTNGNALLSSIAGGIAGPARDILIQSNSTTVARINMNSGYTGAGTLFLADDGTYKTASGGSSPFTNNLGIVQFSPGQAVTNELRVVSGSADAATNVAFQVDTANLFTASGSLLAAFGNAGTNQLTISPWGGVGVGPSYLNPSLYGPLTPDVVLLSIADVSQGDAPTRTIFLSSQTDDSFTSHGDATLSTVTSGGTNNTVLLLLKAENTTEFGEWSIRAGTGNDVTNSTIQFTDFSGAKLVNINPTIASSGSAVAYLFDTSNTLTNGDAFATFGNAGVPLITLAPAEAGNPAAQIIFGPGTTNVLYRSGEHLIYTNGTTTGYSFRMPDPGGSGRLASFGVLSGGGAKLSVGTGQGIFISPDNESISYVAQATAFGPSALNASLGTSSTTGRWLNLHLDNNIVWNGTTNNLIDTWGVATPEGAESAVGGSLFRNATSGALYKKSTIAAGNTGWETVHSGNMAYLAADATVADATFVNLSLSATVQNGKKYSFKLVIFLANSTPTDGAKFDFDGGSATATNFRVHGTAFGSALSGSAQSSALATDHTVTTVTGDNMMEFNGSFEPSSSGTFIPRFAENVDAGGTLTVYRGSNLILTEIP